MLHVLLALALLAPWQSAALARSEADEAALGAATELVETYRRGGWQDDAQAFRARVEEAIDRLIAAPALECDPVAHLRVAELGKLATDLGLFTAADRSLAWALERMRETLDERHPKLAHWTHQHGVVLAQLGRGEPALALLRRAVELDQAQPTLDRRAARLHRTNLALVLNRFGHVELAREQFAQLIAASEGVVAETDADLIQLRMSFADCLFQLGDAKAARDVQEYAVGLLEATLPPDDDELAWQRLALARTIGEQGDVARADRIFAEVVPALERRLGEGSVDLATARELWADVRAKLGDAVGTAMLCERALAVRERNLSEGDLSLQISRLSFAKSLLRIGDVERARVLALAALSSARAILSEDAPPLAYIRSAAAGILFAAGDPEGARPLIEAAVAYFERAVGPVHEDTLATRTELANVLRDLGALEQAEAIERGILDVYEKNGAPSLGTLCVARANLGATCAELGQFERACEINLHTLALFERWLSYDQPDLQKVLGNLAWAQYSLGRHDDARATFERLARSLRTWIEGGLLVARRSAQERANEVHFRLSALLSCADRVDPTGALGMRAFELVETIRAIACGAFTAERPATDAIEALRERALDLRGRIDRLIADGEAGEETRAQRLAALVLERDRAEAEFRQRMVTAGVAAPEITVASLARRLASGEAAVTYRRYARREHDESARNRLKTTDSMLAYVVRGDGALRRVELGSLAEITELVSAWRAAVETRADARDERDAGEALRARVLDPVLTLAGGARRIRVCLDDVLQLCPLDALPLEQGRVGDGWELVQRVSLARRPRRVAAGASRGALLLGGIDFDASADPGAIAAAIPAAAPLLSTRSGEPQRFAPLAHGEREAREIAEAFRHATGDLARVLTGGEATKAALFELAPSARWLHVATHGWFASPPPNTSARTTFEQAVVALAPMSLCGLALAGANVRSDALGRAPGMITGEELAGLDLSACELVTLSACETSCGVPRAGQGLQSLQAALHCAGARATLTSLWKVDDAWTRALMSELYRHAWTEPQTLERALWAAKSRLREQRAPLREWSAWVLTSEDE